MNSEEVKKDIKEEIEKELCSVCDNELSAGEADDYEVNGNKYCETCHEEKYTSCYDCGDLIEQNNAKTSDNGDYYCKNCYDLNFISCDFCSDEVSNDDTHEVQGDSICYSCYEDKTFCCVGCDLNYYSGNGDEHYCEPCGESYCSDCWDEHGCNVGINPNFIDGKICKEMPFFDHVGLEIETFGEVNAPKFDFITTSGDGSIKPDFGDAIEIKTLPTSGNKLVENTKLLCGTLRAEGFKVNQSCGLHVHIDCRKLRTKPLKLSNLVLTYYAFEDILYSMLPKSRWTNQYCLPLFEDYKSKDLKNKTLDKFSKKWYKSEYYAESTTDQHHSSRYHNINVHSIFYRGSLEIRMHSGTLDSEKILNWVYLLLKIKKWALNNYDDEIIQKAIKMKTGKRKYNLFLQTFNLNKNKKISEYIQKRIEKFNPLALTNKQNYWSIQKECSNIKNKREAIGDKMKNYIDDTIKKNSTSLPNDSWDARRVVERMLSESSTHFKSLKKTYDNNTTEIEIISIKARKIYEKQKGEIEE